MARANGQEFDLIAPLNHGFNMETSTVREIHGIEPCQSPGSQNLKWALPRLTRPSENHNDEESDFIVPSNPGFDTEPLIVSKICDVTHCQSLVSQNLKWNSRFLPYLARTNDGHNDKRKKVTVTMEEKLRALQRLDAGEPVKIIAKELGVGRSTVSDWKKHRTEIEKWYANQAGGSCIKARKTMRKGKHALVEKALYHWYEYVRRKGFQVSGPLLQQKALQFKEKIEGEEGDKFSASEGWLDRWKKRFGIGHLLNTSITQNEDDNLVEELKKDLLELGNLKGEQLYCCGRSLFNYRMLPTNILGSDAYEDSKHELIEESFMVLACSNATGNHKLRLTFIGKSERFLEFESIRDDELLPFWYSHQSEVWLDNTVLKTWFDSEFVPAVEKNLSSNNLPRKAVLLVTNYPSFSNLSELQNGDIRALFVPVQAASLLQPMERGVLESLKKKYWCRLLNSVISTSTDSENCIKTLKNIDVVGAIQFTLEAWEEIPSLTFVHSWQHLIDQTGEKEWAELENQVISKENDDLELLNLLKKICRSDDVSLQDVNEWLLNEEDEEIISEDIVAMVLREPQTDLDVSEECLTNEEDVKESAEVKVEPSALDEDSCTENMTPQIKRIRHSEGFKAITKALEYISQQEEVTPEDIVWSLKWRDIAATKSSQEEKRKKFVKKSKPY